MIERDRLILSQIKNIAKVSMQAKYRVIGVYDKSYNKWFMAKENNKHWMSLSQQERKKYKVAIRMVEDVDKNPGILYVALSQAKLLEQCLQILSIQKTAPYTGQGQESARPGC
jgi:hypothetical protein